jgi:8-oxo-dGTP diphosphatase
MATQNVIRAAGVVLLRTENGRHEFLVVHRPGRKDWSLPKGKLDPGEHMLTAAIRECDEESGFTPVLQSPLPMQSYSVAGRPKVVHYWRAHVREETGFAPDDEVDQVLWLPVTTARESLTYPTEARLVALAAAMPDTVPFVLVRHTQALKRSQFDGDDDADRPLSGKGRSQAKALLPLLDAFGLTELHSSPSRRCRDTLHRFAKLVGAEVHPEPLLSEEGHAHKPSHAEARAIELALTPQPLALCTHRPVLPTVVAAVSRALGMEPGDPRWRAALDPKLPAGGLIVFHREFAPDGAVSVVGVEQHTLSTD